MREQIAKPTNILKLAAGSIAVSLVVLGLKYLAYALTGSVALYSDAIESIINVVTGIAAFFAIRIPTDELAAVQATISANMTRAIEAHDLRSRHAGRMTFIDVHLVVDCSMTVDTSHAICDRVEAALKADHPDSIISIHVEPEAKRKHGTMAIM